MFHVFYGDHLHCKNGTHIYVGVADGAVWYNRWQIIINLPIWWYNVPVGPAVCHFVRRPILYIKELHSRDWNDEHILVCTNVNPAKYVERLFLQLHMIVHSAEDLPLEPVPLCGSGE